MDKNVIAVLNAAIDLAKANDPDNLTKILLDKIYSVNYVIEVAATCIYFRLNPDMIRGDIRADPYPKARRFISYLMKENGHSVEYIGLVLNRNQSDISKHVKKLEDQKSRYPDIIETINAVRKIIKEIK